LFGTGGIARQARLDLNLTGMEFAREMLVKVCLASPDRRHEIGDKLCQPLTLAVETDSSYRRDYVTSGRQYREKSFQFNHLGLGPQNWHTPCSSLITGPSRCVRKSIRFFNQEF
jgi:hypothetical protein